MNQENEEFFTGGNESAMSKQEQDELLRFRKTPEKISKRHRGERGLHEGNMQASEIGSLIVDVEGGDNDAILRFVEEGDRVLFGVSEEERDKWASLSPEVKQKALGFYALLRLYFDKGEEMSQEKLRHLEDYFKRFLVLIRDSSPPGESKEEIMH